MDLQNPFNALLLLGVVGLVILIIFGITGPIFDHPTQSASDQRQPEDTSR